jgi:Na+-driven multidrug efflux pump
MSVNASFNGMGKPIPGVIISACRVIIVFLPLALLGKALFEMPGLFAATTISNLLMGTVAYAWLGRQVNQARSISPQPSP